MPQKSTRPKKGGGLFSSSDGELVAFDRLKQLLYIAKNCSQDKNPSSFAKTLNFLRRLGFPLLNVCKKDSATMRCDAFKSKFTSARRLFFSSFASTSSVTNSVFIKNKSSDPTDLFPPRSGSLHTGNKDVKHPNIRNRTIKELSPVDFATYLMFEADNKTKITSSSLFKQVNSRLPFFKTLEDFTTAFNDLSNLTYIQRSEVFYVFAEFYLRLSQRSHALYQVELDSYGSLLLDGSSDHKRKEAHRKLKSNLSRGDRTRRIATSSDDVSSYFGDPLTDLIDSRNGLPVSTLRGGALWSADDGPDIPLTTALQMTEVLLNEPLFSDKDIIDPTINLKQTLEIDGYDPLLIGSLEALSVSKHKHYVEDVRKKLLISMRAVRKNLLLHKFKARVDSFVMTKEAAKYDAESLPVESKVSEILKSIFRPVVAEVDHAVLPNLAEAYKFIFSETSSSLGLADFDSLMSRPSYSSSPSYSSPSYSSPYTSSQNVPATGNMPVL